MSLQFNEIESEQGLLGLGYSFDKTDFSFSTIYKKNEFTNNKGDSLLRLAIGIDESKVAYSRSVFTFWDFLGDVGGLYDMLILIGGQLVALIQFAVGSGLNRFLIRHLFTVERKASNSQLQS